MTQYIARLKQIGRFSRAGKSFRDRVKCAVIGFARGHPFRVGSIEKLVVRLRLIDPLIAVVYLNDLGQLLSFEEIFLERVYDLELVPFVPELVVDCGAHAGFFSLLASKRYGKVDVVAFEPAPNNFRVLKEQAKANALEWELHQCAIAVRDGESFFESGSASNIGHLVEHSGSGSDAAYVVRTVDLAKSVRERTPGSLLLKMDIEGAEQFVLARSLDALPGKTAIFFETHDGETAREDIYRLLRAAGFAVRCVRLREPYADSFAVRT
jgi:FkbM family methyltransferase